MRHFICGLLVALIVGAVMGYVGGGDFEEALRQEAEYCERVADHVHSDYKKLCSEEMRK